MDRRGVLIAFLVSIISIEKAVLGWNFASLNTTNDEVTILHVSVYYLRAYLSIKSDVEGWRSE